MGETSEAPIRRQRPGTISLQESEALLSHPDTARVDRWIYRNTNDEEVPEGYHRVVGTYDDLVPVSWIDVPDGTADPMPNYLSTSAAQAYLGTDDLPSWDRPERWLGGEGGSDSAYARPRRWLAAVPLLAFVLGIVGIGAFGPHTQPVLLGLLLMGMLAAFMSLVIVATPGLPESTGRGSRERLSSSAAADEGEAQGEDAIGILRDLRSDSRIGELAGRGVKQAEESRTLHDRLLGLVGDRFTEGSLSWHRFADGCEAGCESIDRNVVTMAGIAADAGGEGRHKALATLVDDNESILEGLRSLEGELLQLAVDELSRDNREVAENLGQMSREVRHYRRPE